jgi:outer membrane receptor for ferrienterochelin and colicins
MRPNILGFICVFIIAIGNAQNSPLKVRDTILIQELEEVIISATRTIRQLSSLPLPAQIISKKEIVSINSLRLDDLLEEQTGLITVSDFGGGEGVQMQGLDSQYTLILIDGVPLVGRSAGTLDLNRVSVGNIKQIEIVKGASSSLYGSEALGGVINIITDTPKIGLNGTISQRTSSFNTFDTGLEIGYKKNKIGLGFFVNRLSSDGYDLNENTSLKTVNPYSNYTINTKVNYKLNDKTRLDISARFFTQNQVYIASEVLRGESDINEWNTHIKASHVFSDAWNSELEFYTTRYKADEFLNDMEDQLFSNGFFNQLLVRPEFRTNYQVSENGTLTGGLGVTHETLKRTDFSESPIFNSPYLYLQYDTDLIKVLNLIIGARFDSHSKYTSQFSPKVALRYQLNDNLSAKGSVGYGFKAPDFRQLYFNFTNATVGYTVLGYNAVPDALEELELQGEINTFLVPPSEFEDNLNPESSIAINIGLDFKPMATISIGLNAFRNNIDDLIDTRVIANKTNGQNVFSYYNVNKVYTQGIEFNTTWKPNNNIKVSGGYQLLYAKDKRAEEAFENGEVFARENPSSPSFQLYKDDYFGLFNRSKHMANFKIFYSIEKWKVNANIRGTYRSKYGLFDSNSNNYLDDYDTFVSGYSIWDFAFNKSFYESFGLGIGVDNILNFTDEQNISSIPGRIFYGKLNIHF